MKESAPERRDPTNLLQLWRLAFLVATPLGVTSSLWVYFGMQLTKKPLTLQTALLAGLPDWYFWAALTPPVFWLGYRFRIERSHWLRMSCIHACAGAAVVLVELLIVSVFRHLYYYNPYSPPAATLAEAYMREVLRSFQFAFIIYWLIVAAAHASWYYREFQARQLEASRLNVRNAELATLLSESQLNMLRAQLQPHFLFNALNAISGVVRERRTEDATELISSLGQLLRQAMAKGGRELIPLREELDVLAAYVRVEQARFRDRLAVSYDLDPAVLERMVPALILQPLVENAIRHGTGNGVTRLEVRIEVKKDGGGVVALVADNGGGLRDSAARGIGLTNTSERLHRLYGTGEWLRLRNRGQGVCATLRLPAEPLAAVTA